MERKGRERKPRQTPESRETDPETADALDPGLEEFEDVDLTAVEPEAAETTAESVEGLGSPEQFRALVQAQREVEQRLLVEPAEAMAAAAVDGTRGRANIVGVGIGEKAVDGIPTGRLAVKVLVKEKLNPDEVASEAFVPDDISGVPTDVDVSGEIRAQTFNMRLRPAPGGVSVGTCAMITAGTFGCLVRRANQLFILSNNHVLASVNTSPIGTLIPQSGRLDGGLCPQDAIAKLSQFIPITFAAGQCNFVDCAIAQASPSLVDRRMLRPGGVRQPLQAPTVAPVLNQLVQKSGRTTQFRRGIVDLVNATVNVSYAPLGGVARFCQQFRVRGAPPVFSDRGDSGSLVTTVPQNNPVGLLFAGNAVNDQTFCNPIRAVLAALAVSIVF